MKLYTSQLSPFARKVRILILEKNLQEQVELIESNPYEATAEHLIANPLSKVPALTLANGESLYESYVICEYLDALSGDRLMPQAEKHLPALQQMALTDGLMQTTFSIAVELNRRAESERSMDWVDRWAETLVRGVDALANVLPTYEDSLTLPHIGAVCALDYLDLRASDRVDWRKQQPSLNTWYDTFGERAAMQQTRPVA